MDLSTAWDHPARVIAVAHFNQVEPPEANVFSKTLRDYERDNGVVFAALDVVTLTSIVQVMRDLKVAEREDDYYDMADNAIEMAEYLTALLGLDTDDDLL